MFQFTFRSNNGEEVTVEASTDEQARKLAMKKLWGGDKFRLSAPEPGTKDVYTECEYRGIGLDLIRERCI